MGRLLIRVAVAVAVVATGGPAAAERPGAAPPAPPAAAAAAPASDGPVPLRRVAMAANFFKPLLGIIQLESEVHLTGRVALRVSAEYLFVRQEDFDHPDFFAFLGPRVYVWSHLPGDRQSGLEIGPFAGLSCMFLDEQPCAAVAGTEIGYRVPLGKHVFVLGRGLAHVAVEEPRLVLGGEILAGFRFGAVHTGAR